MGKLRDEKGRFLKGHKNLLLCKCKLKRKCEICGIEFSFWRQRKEEVKYCSRKCACIGHHRARQTKCKICKKLRYKKAKLPLCQFHNQSYSLLASIYKLYNLSTKELSRNENIKVLEDVIKVRSVINESISNLKRSKESRFKRSYKNFGYDSRRGKKWGDFISKSYRGNSRVKAHSSVNSIGLGIQ